MMKLLNLDPKFKEAIEEQINNIELNKMIKIELVILFIINAISFKVVVALDNKL